MKQNRRELEILNILYSSDQALTSAQIVRAGDGLTQSTVQAVIRKLMADKMIEEKGVTYSGNVLSRTFGVTERSREVLNQLFIDYLRTYKSIIGLRAVICGMFEMEEDETKKGEYIEILEELLDELKGQMEK